MNRIKNILIVITILIGSVYVYDKSSFKKIFKKKHSHYFRIGYINLHGAAASRDDLRKLEKYNCDLWLFLEWNGNNFNSYAKFPNIYFKYEVKDKKTLGLCILSKDRRATVVEIGREKEYLCNYPKHLIKYGQNNNLAIYLVHVPPPVPSCGMETEKYISDFTSELWKSESYNANIIVGDFNTLSFQSGIKGLKKKGYIDVHSSLNKLPQGTFGPFIGFPKILKLDYIFYKGKIAPKYVARFSLNTSDHSGFVADFEL